LDDIYPLTLPENNKTVWHFSDSFTESGTDLIFGFLHENYAIGMHTHEFYELNIVLSGKGLHYFCGHRFELSEGDIFVIPPMMPHGYYNIDSLNVYHVLIRNDFFTRYKTDIDLMPGLFPLFFISPQIRDYAGLKLFEQLDGEQLAALMPYIDDLTAVCKSFGTKATRVTLRSLMANHTMIRLLIALSPMLDHRISNRECEHIISSLEYIHRNYDKKLTADQLAADLYMSRTAYFAMFKRFTGLTPAAYIENCRIENAKAQLELHELSATDIALKCGFYDCAHFTRCFKRCTGMTPGEYREKMDETAAKSNKIKIV